MDHTVYLALGANLGDRAANLRAAVAALPPAVKVLALSPIYETPPWGLVEQPPFLNQVLRGETSLNPLDLLVYLKEIERRLGRQKTVRYGPRTIDLDILFYDLETVETPELTIPHPRLPERAFVLVPLADLDPDLRHPGLGVSVRKLLEQVDRSAIKPFHPA